MRWSHGPVATADGDVRIAGTVTDYVIVGEGDLVVSGRVTRGVVVVHGNARISGRVRGDVVALTGTRRRHRATAASAATSCRGATRRSPAARSTVRSDGVDLRGIFTGIIIGLLAYLWIAVTISMAILGLAFVGLLPRAADTAAAAGKRVAASFGWGALVGIVGPMVAVLVLVTVARHPARPDHALGAQRARAARVRHRGLIIGRHWVKGTSNRRPDRRVLRRLRHPAPGRARSPASGCSSGSSCASTASGAVSMAAWYGGHRVRDDDESPPDAAPPTQPPPMEPPTEPPTEPPAPEPDPVDAPIG